MAVELQTPPKPTIPSHRIIRARVEVLRRGEWVDVSGFLSSVEINRGDHTGVGVNPSGTDGVAKMATITLKNQGAMQHYWQSTLIRHSTDVLGDSEDLVSWSNEPGQKILDWLFGPSAGWARENLSPRDRTSPVNLVEENGDLVYDPLLWPNREIRVWGRAIADPGELGTELVGIGDGETDTYVLSHAAVAESVQIQTGYGPRWSDLDDMTWEEASQLTWSTITQPTTPPSFSVDGLSGTIVLSRPLDEGELLVVTYHGYNYDTGWVCEFHGLIGNRIASDGHTVTLEVTDLSKRLQKAYIFDAPETPYEGPMEDVMQAILNNHPSTQGVVLYFPSGTPDNPRPAEESPTWFVTGWSPNEMSVFDALGRLASRRGWYVGYRWHEPTKQMQLQLLAPPRWRDIEEADYRLSWMTDFYAHDLEDSDESIVNYVEVVWRAPNGEEHTTVRQNPDSINEFGLLAGRIREDDAGDINDKEAAERLANAVIDDLSDMRGASSLDMPIIPGLDVFASFALDDPRISSSQDFLGVENVLQIYDFESGRFRSQVNGPNRVVGGFLKWLNMIVRPGRNQVPPRQRPKGHVVVAAANASNYWKGIADYICDGVNDQEEINMALENGSSVELSEGTFSPSGSLLIGERQTLMGQGRATVLRIPQEPVGYLWGLMFTDGPDVTIQNLVMDGNYRNGDGDPQFVGVVIQHDGVSLARCDFVDISADAVRAAEANRLAFRDCTFTDVRGTNIYVSGASNPNVSFADFEASGCSFTGNFHTAIQLLRSLSNIRITNNSIARDGNLAFDGSRGIVTHLVDDVKISGNTIRNVGTGIIANSSTNRQEGAMITDNAIRRARRGISASSFRGKLSITANTIVETLEVGVAAGDTEDAVIEANTLEGTGETLIYVFRGINGYGNNNTVRSNTCRKTPSGSLLYGIRIHDGEGNFVSTNDVLNSGDVEPIQNDGVGTIVEGNRQ